MCEAVPFKRCKFSPWLPVLCFWAGSRRPESDLWWSQPIWLWDVSGLLLAVLFIIVYTCVRGGVLHTSFENQIDSIESHPECSKNKEVECCFCFYIWRVHTLLSHSDNLCMWKDVSHKKGLKEHIRHWTLVSCKTQLVSYIGINICHFPPPYMYANRCLTFQKGLLLLGWTTMTMLRSNKTFLVFFPFLSELRTQRALVNVWIPSVFLQGRAANAYHVYQVALLIWIWYKYIFFFMCREGECICTIVTF